MTKNLRTVNYDNQAHKGKLLNFKQVPHRLPSRTTPSSNSFAIPRIIYQTFETRIIAEKMYDAAMTWIDINPDYEWRFCTHEDRRELISRQFDNDVLKAYDRLDHGAFRADLWRYCQLYVSGGIYADIDFICKMPLSELITPEDKFIAARADNVPHGIFNGFLCSKPHHPFLEAMINSATKKILQSTGPIDGYKVTGPWGLGVEVNKLLKRRQKHSFDIGRNAEADHEFRLLQKNSKSQDSEGSLTENGKIVLYTKYNGYESDLADMGLTHWKKEKNYVKRSNSRLRKIVRSFRKKFPGWI